MYPTLNKPADRHFLRNARGKSSGGPRRRAAWAMSLLLVSAAGCNPVTTGAKLGVRLVGEVIEDADVKQRGDSLVGRPVSAADQAFGARLDAFKDIRSERRWQTYPVKMDVLGRQRYVVEVSGGTIVSVSKSETSGRKVDIPLVLVLKEKLKSKSPQECEAKLGYGRPLLQVRSEVTRRLVQLYDAGRPTDLGTPHYCIVRFDANDRCEEVEFVAVGASTSKNPVTRVP